MPVPCSAYGVECLVVFRFKLLVFQVELILLVCAALLYLCGESPQVDIFGDDIGNLIFPATADLLKPAAYLVTIITWGCAEIYGKLANLSVFLNQLCTHHGAVLVVISQCKVGLLYHVEHVVHAGLLHCHRDGDNTVCPIALVCDGTYLTVNSLNVCDGVLCANHLFGL